MKRYPFVKQLSTNDCGAACVSMLIKAVCSVEIHIRTVKNIIGSDEKGSTFWGIKCGLEELGIYGEVSEVQGSISALEGCSRFPILTQVQKEGEKHFVLIYEVHKGKALIADPAKRKISKIDIKQLEEKWIPFIFHITDIKTEEFPEHYINEKDDKFLFIKTFANVKGKILLSWIMLLVIYYLAIASTYVFTVYFDTIIPLSMTTFIPYITLIFAIVMVVQLIFNYLYTKISLYISNQVDLELNDLCLREIFAKKYNDIERIESGELLTCLKSISQVREKYFYWIMSFPIDLMKILFIYSFLYSKNKALAAIILLPIVFSIAVTILTHETLNEKSLEMYNDNEKFNIHSIQIISNLTTLKSFSVLESFQEKMISELKKIKNKGRKLALYSIGLSGIKSSILSLFTLLVFSIGSYYVIIGDLVSGTLLMFNSLSMQIINPFLSIVNMQMTYEQGKIADLKLRDIIYREQGLSKGNCELHEISDFQLANVTFSYRIKKVILKNISMHFAANKSYAIIGKSGVGKTTLGKVICGYYDVDSGKILCNGRDINEYYNISSKILFVKQDTAIFSDTILNNILLGRDIPIEYVKRKAEKIGFTEIVNQFPDGYDTVIGENGRQLSLGQAQLLNILRATLESYELIVFDEVMNGLDAEYREKVRDYLFSYGNIKIFITHDLNFAKMCDYIGQLENGKMYWTEVKGDIK